MQINKEFVDTKKWCGCFSRYITKKNHLNSLTKARYETIEILDEKPNTEDHTAMKEGRDLTS
jgi:hypothetical protein